MSRPPVAACQVSVADDGSVKSPLALQDAVQQRVIVAAVNTLPHVVAAHDAPHVGFLDGLLEGGQINLVDGTFAGVDIGSKAVHLLVVQEEVFEAAGHTVGLGCLDVGHYHLAG